MSCGLTLIVSPILKHFYHSPGEFRRVLDRTEAAVFADADVHPVMDNCAARKTRLIRDWLARRPRWTGALQIGRITEAGQQWAVAMDLSRYEHAKFALAELLRTLPWTSQQAERLRALFGRLAEDRFNLVVVGRFSRGKSSLMNAILGADWLPTGIVPLTSVVTAVAHGETESVILHHEHTSLVTDITLAELSACQSAFNIDPHLECAPAGGQVERVGLTLCLGFRRMEVMARHRSHSVAFKRQVAEEFIAGETLECAPAGGQGEAI